MPFSLSYTPGQRINPRDYDGGESMRRGISEALETYLRKKQADRDFENEVAQSGGTVDPQESGMDKLRRVGGAIRRHLPGFDPRPGAEENLRVHGDPQVSAQPITDADVSSAMGDPGTSRSSNVVTINPNRSQNRSLDTLGTARDGVTRSPIADAIERTVVRGPSGQTAIVPTKRGLHQQDVADEQAVRTDSEQRQIDALKAAGMPEAEARARVLTNTVRYDEDFGQRRMGSMTYTERANLEELKNKLAMERIRVNGAIRAAQRSGDQAALLRAQNAARSLDLQERRILAGEQTEIIRENPLPAPGLPERIATSTPEGEAAVAQTQRTRAAAEKKRHEAVTGGADDTRATINQAQYDQAILQGHSNAEIDQHYKVATGVRRRPDRASTRADTTARR